MNFPPAIAQFLPRLRWWALVVLSVAPFQLMLVEHLGSGSFATGFVDYDGPYYVANGREIFERGNGLAHPNPYDPDPSAPVIYFHWLTWLLGFGVKFLRLDPGVLYAGLGLAAAILGGALTLRLVEAVLPSRSWRAPLFLLTMWGGGLLGVGAMAYNFFQGAPPLEDLFVFDGAGGWWGPNWGRNFALPMEAVYHSLVAVAWLGVIERRWARAIGAVGLLAATHPFSGGQHLLILGAWLGGDAVRARTPAAWARAGVVLAMSIAFAAYYFVFLPSFPAHRALVERWSNVWTMPLATLLLASGPAAIAAGWRLRQQGWKLGPTEQFLVIACATTVLLMKHDWFLPSHQPAHFSRGYNWLPLWLLALPWIQSAGEKLTALRPRWLAVTILWLGAGLTISDNVAFIGNELTRGELDRQHLSPEQREMFSWMDAHKLSGTLLTSDPRMSYLSATYTSAQPYYGHRANTPGVRDRWRKVAAWQTRGTVGDWLLGIDYLLIDRTDPPANFEWKNWPELHRNHDYLLLGREIGRRSTPERPVQGLRVIPVQRVREFPRRQSGREIPAGRRKRPTRKAAR